MSCPLNNAPSPHTSTAASITAFMSKKPSIPICTFLQTSKAQAALVDEAKLENVLNVKEREAAVTALYPIVKEALRKTRLDARNYASWGEAANFVECDFVLVARKEFNANKTLALPWRGPRRITNALSNYVF